MLLLMELFCLGMPLKKIFHVHSQWLAIKHKVNHPSKNLDLSQNWVLKINSQNSLSFSFIYRICAQK